MREISPRKSPCYCINLKRATNTITKFYDKKMESAGLTASQFSLLNDIRLLGTCSKAELSEYAKLDKSTITRNLLILRDKGYVKDLSTNGSRESQVSLTDLGLEKIEEGNMAWKEAQEYIKEKVGGENIVQLKKILDVIENDLSI
ncbi:MarR family winged helix-turn-helix transcriptional regulator [Youngiibacter multivorans]|uniref:DNA-binding MarR family transcriptional regulator n=1 Tax=Youngiibacter multivorans TaxID=937251 RepID=A0ABS4FZE2_9CLOT|nr:MarR family winged helix-turn-helix transcriptional regulator [Youngiibacter multivorans]MBP1917666.1 DNA-binding MarR family transcriptional regulator [Youngiibacter multivorans]